MSALIESIKAEEGFKGMPYEDHLYNPTIGYGTLLPLSEKEAEMILEVRLYSYIQELIIHKPFMAQQHQVVKDVIYEMGYQMGIPRFLEFKKMWKALEDGNINEAIKEAIDSRWYRQTTNRAKRLVGRLEEYSRTTND